MFGKNYFGGRYYGQRYFGGIGGIVVAIRAFRTMIVLRHNRQR